MPPKVSVIIPTYNHSRYVLETLDSVFAQTFTDYEVIVINDGSPDDTAQVLAPLATAGKIKYIEQPNAGQAAARNRGLAEAKGEFIAFLDDDDLWPPDKLKWQIKALEEDSNVVFVSGVMQLVDEQGELLHQEHYTAQYYAAGPVSFESLFRGNPFGSPGQILIRAAPLHRSGGLDETLWGVDDFDLWFRLSRCGKIVTLPHLGLYYRTHSSNASQDSARMYANTLIMFKKQLQAAPRSKHSLLSRIAHRSLYIYIGINPIWYLRTHKLKSFPSIFQHIPRFLYFLGPMARDRVLLVKVIKECTPHMLQPLLSFMGKKIK